MELTLKPIYILIGALIVIAGLAFVLVTIFKPGSDSATVAPPVVLADHASESNSVSYLVDGVINSPEKHRAIQITVSNTVRTLQVFSGYQGNELIVKTYPNNVESYKEFLAALQTIGSTNYDTKATSDNYLGQCPFGYRFVIRTSGFKDVPEMLWTTSCSDSSGNFRGNLEQINQLFKKQIPDYDAVIKGVSLK